MTEISHEDGVLVAEWLGDKVIHIEWVHGVPCAHSDGMLFTVVNSLYFPEVQQTIIKKILTFAALHLEEIPKPEAVIMPFCDLAGRDDYEGHGETIENALINAVLKLIKEGGYEYL